MMNNFNNQGFTGQGFTQGFNNQATGFGGGQQAPLGYQQTGFTNFQNPMNVGGGFNQSFTNQTQGFSNQSLPNQGNNNQNFGTQGFGVQAFTNQTQGFGTQGFTNQATGFGGQQVNSQVIDRIHQNSLFNGASQFENPQVQRIQQASLFHGGSQPMGSTNFQNPMHVSGMGQGFTNQASFGTQGLVNQGNVGVQGSFGTQGLVNQGNVGTQGFTNQAFGGTQGFGGGQQINSQVIDRIHQASLFNGGSQPEYATNFQNPMNQGFTNQMTGFANQGSFGTQGLVNQGNVGAQGFGGQQVNSQVIDRIHQNSLFNGASQFDNSQVARIQQNTISGNTSNPLSVGFGGISSGGFTNNVGQPYQQQMFANHANNGTAFRAVMNADAGIRDAEGPNSYPASMYTGSNQYDTVNPSVLSQVLGRQF